MKGGIVAVAGDRRLVRVAGLTGAAAAALSVWADFVLQYTPAPSHLMSRQYLFLLDRSPADLLLGHYVGIFGILLQIAGFWAVSRGLAPAGRAAELSYFFLGASAMALGAAFHATFAPIGLALHAMGGDPQRITALADQVRPAQTALGGIVVLGILTAALLFSGIVLRGRTDFPRWMAAVTPLTLAIVIGLAARLVPPLRLVVLPCGLNCAAMIFFLLATTTLWNRTEP